METGILEKKHVPNYWKNFWYLVVRNHSISSAKFVDRLAGVYGDRPLYFLDRNLDCLECKN